MIDENFKKYLEEKKLWLMDFSFRDLIKKEEDSKLKYFVLCRDKEDARNFFKEHDITWEKYYICTKNYEFWELEDEIENCAFERIILLDDYDKNKKRDNLFHCMNFQLALKKFVGNQNKIEMFFL